MLFADVGLPHWPTRVLVEGAGTLAPYKVVRIGLDKDLDGWRPEKGQTDRFGNEIADREYNQTDFDKTIILDQRTRRVAGRITEFLHATNRFAKTIVFCENVDHAERMRMALVNCNPDLAAANPRYVMRITGDNDEGQHLCIAGSQPCYSLAWPPLAEGR
jgi:type I restriction enzyme R subunit